MRSIIPLVLVLGMSGQFLADAGEITGNPRFSLQTAFSSWTESFHLLDPNQSSYLLGAFILGVSLGGTFEVPLSRYVSWNIGTDLVYGQATVGVQNGVAVNSSLQYQAQNVPVYGICMRTALLWVLQPQASIGLEIPVLYQKALWPTPPDGYSVNAPLFFSGYQLVGRLGGALQVIPKMGFLDTFTHFFWSLGLGYAF